MMMTHIVPAIARVVTLSRLEVSMRHATLLSLVALLSLVPTRGSAQMLHSFEDLALRVNLADQLQVHDRSGGKVTGRLMRFTRDEIVLRTDAGERRFTNDAVREIAVRGHVLGKGALIGSCVFAVLGGVAASRTGNAFGTAGATAVGAGVGAAAGSLVPAMRTIYRAPADGVSVSKASGPRDAADVQPSLVDELGARINLDDRLRVEDQSGVRTSGRLTGLTADEIAIRTDTGEMRFARAALREVAVRRSSVRLLTLIGAGAGMLAGGLAACRGESRPECADGIVLVGGVGAGLGTITGALLRTTTIVYSRSDRVAVVVPTVLPRGAGVRVGLTW